jgi:hypothetical protein
MSARAARQRAHQRHGRRDRGAAIRSAPATRLCRTRGPPVTPVDSAPQLPRSTRRPAHRSASADARAQAPSGGFYPWVSDRKSSHALPHRRRERSGRGRRASRIVSSYLAHWLRDSLLIRIRPRESRAERRVVLDSFDDLLDRGDHRGAVATLDGPRMAHRWAPSDSGTRNHGEPPGDRS